MRKVIGTLTLLVLFTACSSAPAVQAPAPVPGPAAPGETGAVNARTAIVDFMGAVKAQNLQAMSAVWGTKDGSVRNSEVMSRTEMEKRELIMICYLRHDSFQILSEAPGTSGLRVFNVELTAGPLKRATNFYAIQGPGNRWYVQQVDTEPVRDICQSR